MFFIYSDFYMKTLKISINYLCFKVNIFEQLMIYNLMVKRRLISRVQRTSLTPTKTTEDNRNNLKHTRLKFISCTRYHLLLLKYIDEPKKNKI